MPAISFGSGPAKGLGFTGSSVPESRKFPAGTVIPFMGNNPGISGWRRFSEADGCCLYAYTPSTLANYSNLGRIDPQVPFSLSLGGSTASAGSHSGTNVYEDAYLTTGTKYINTGSNGAHTHTASGFNSVSGTTDLITTHKRTFLIATQSVETLPIYSIVSKQTGSPLAQSTPIYAQAPAVPSGTTYPSPGPGGFLIGANEPFLAPTPERPQWLQNTEMRTTKSVDFSTSATPTLSTAGAHAHGSAARKTQLPAGQRFYAWSLGGYNGDHTHAIGSWTAVQTKIACKLIDFYMLFSATVPETDLIVMYVNTVPPPPQWTFVPGLTGNVIGYGNSGLYSSNQWGVSVAHDARVTASGTISSAYVPHNHDYGYSPANLAAGSYPNINASGQHTNYGWSHTHTTGTITAAIQPYIPKKIYVGFIKYTGA